RNRGVPLLAGADGEPEPAPDVEQARVPAEPAASAPAAAQPAPQWGRGAASSQD
ncbi:rhomboid family intramembrane serine protease, partial [Mesorhizobium sp. M4A.F.Ca.ET.020.02.1.1]